MNTTEFVEEAYVNEFGQTIKPGEEILYAGSTRKSTSIRKAFFKGVRYANVTRHQYLKDENGNYIKEDYLDKWSGRTLQRTKTETKTSREVVSVVVRANRGKQYKWTTGPDGKKAYVKTDEDVYGTSILPLKRVYKFSTNLSELVGQSF
jgi:hypothetical protein